MTKTDGAHVRCGRNSVNSPVKLSKPRRMSVAFMSVDTDAKIARHAESSLFDAKQNADFVQC